MVNYLDQRINTCWRLQTSYEDGKLIQVSTSQSAQPYNSKYIKMHKLKRIVIQYCKNFQTGNYRFGEKCKFKHEIHPEFMKKEIIVDIKKKKDIITFKKLFFNISTFHNNNAGPPRGK